MMSWPLLAAKYGRTQGHNALEFACGMRDVYISVNLEIDPCGAEMISLWEPWPAHVSSWRLGDPPPKMRQRNCAAAGCGTPVHSQGDGMAVRPLLSKHRQAPSG